VFRLRLGLLRRILQSPCISNGVRVDLAPASAFACVVSAGVLALAALAAAQPDASAAPIPVAVAAPDDLARLWSEAVRLERASWDLAEMGATGHADRIARELRELEG
jgi:hypothetical protein